MSPKSQTQSTYDKECLAIILAIEKWKTYLQHRTFTIDTNQQSLVHLWDHKLNTAIKLKAFFKLVGLQYKIMYQKGDHNKATDALSIREHVEELRAISGVQPKWLETVVEWYHKEDKALQLLTELNIHNSNDQGFELVVGVI